MRGCDAVCGAAFAGKAEHLTRLTHNDAATQASRRPLAGIGRVLLWSGGSLWIGREAGRVEPHAHHAIQITLAMDAPFLMRDGDGLWGEHRGAVVMPHRRHQFDGCGHRSAMIFIEPEAAQGRRLLARFAAAGVADLDHGTAQAMVGPLQTAYAAGAGNDVLMAMAQQAAAALAGQAPGVAAVDSRVSRAIAWVRARLDSPLSLQDAAEVAHLSPSRFRHLFVAQTGVSFRAYLLWARVEMAVGAAMGGQSWTAAAQVAGFADSAHLSRTCRRMFGFAPVTLVKE